MKRRDFLGLAITVAIGITIVPSNVLGKTLGHVSPSDKLNIAGIGIGGMGRNNLRNMSGENIVALCDVDWDYAGRTFNDYPKAKKFKDWRMMFDDFGKSIDAVMVATPDHSHATVTAHAITQGKHVFMALKLKYPSKVEASSTVFNTESAPHASIIEYTFPARKNMPDLALPEVKVTWYDGGLLPSRPEELTYGEILGKKSGGGLLFVGSKGKFMTCYYGMEPVLLPYSEMDGFKEPSPVIPRIPGGKESLWDGAHERDLIRACKETAENRKEASANFEYSGPFNEMVVMGVLATRLQDLKRPLLWDGEKMGLTNISDTDNLKILSANDFNVVDGDLRFDRKYEEFNARQIAGEWIKHNYRNGWSLPEMPA